jgi:hypothetical protein
MKSSLRSAIMAAVGGDAAPSRASVAGFFPKCVLIDLSGTLHVEDEAIVGAQNALKRQV